MKISPKPAASMTAAAATVLAARPPEWPRDAIERMNTSSSVAWICIRTRSPRMAPPVIGRGRVDGDDRDRAAGLARLAGERRDERRLAAPRRAGHADQVGAAGQRVERLAAPASPAAVRFSICGQQPRQRAAITRPRALGERAVGHSLRLASASLTLRADVLGHLADGRARAKDARHAGLLELRDVVVGDDPAGRDQHVVHALLMQAGA